MTFTLLGCPFCGKPPKVIESGWHAIIRCDNEYCGADVEVVGTERGAVLESWNTRATASLEGDAVERVARSDFARRCRAYLDDAPLDGRHSDAAGSNAYELIEEAIEHCATGLVPDEATIRADEREKCAKVAVARSDAVMAEAEAAHDDDNYDLYERLECEAGNYMDLAAAIRSNRREA